MAIAEAFHPGIPTPVPETVDFLPPNPRILDIPRSTLGIDETTLRSRAYEGKVAEYVASVTPENYFILGPGVLERVFVSDRDIAVPDYIGSELLDGVLIIRELGEAKLGPRYYSKDKISGFKKLVETYRQRSEVLQARINLALGTDLPPIQIPNEDWDIEVHFIAPRNVHPKSKVQELDTDFRVFYWPLAEA